VLWFERERDDAPRDTRDDPMDGWPEDVEILLAVE
jgi:hypothetical protein